MVTGVGHTIGHGSELLTVEGLGHKIGHHNRQTSLSGSHHQTHDHILNSTLIGDHGLSTNNGEFVVAIPNKAFPEAASSGRAQLVNLMLVGNIAAHSTTPLRNPLTPSHFEQPFIRLYTPNSTVVAELMLVGRSFGGELINDYCAQTTMIIRSDHEGMLTVAGERQLPMTIVHDNLSSELMFAIQLDGDRFSIQITNEAGSEGVKLVGRLQLTVVAD